MGRVQQPCTKAKHGGLPGNLKFERDSEGKENFLLLVDDVKDMTALHEFLLKMHEFIF